MWGLGSDEKDEKKQGGKQKDPWGKDQKGTDLLIANGPRDKSNDAILTALSTAVLSRVGGRLEFVAVESVAEGIHVTLPNNVQFRALLERNGSYVFNQKIWIIKWPEAVGAYTLWFWRVFSRNTSNGVVDLSNLKQKLAAMEMPDDQVKGVNFGNRDFVEFLFYRLGTESRDRRFFVEVVLLNQNGITNVQGIGKFLVFLPTVQRIVVSDNPLKSQDLFIPEHPYVEVICDRIGKEQQTGQKKRQKQ